MLHNKLYNFLIRNVADKRPPDFIIGGEDNPYLLRWYVIPRNKFFNIYLHMFLRSDDDRALHDHPWSNFSYLLDGKYTEHQIMEGGVHKKTVKSAGDFRFRFSGKFAHRIELTHGSCWTLFVTGPKYREWGFHCSKGWVHWEDFVSKTNKGNVGKGCGE